MANCGAKSADLLRYFFTRGVTQRRIQCGFSFHSRGLAMDSQAYPRYAQPSIWQSIIPRAIRNKTFRKKSKNVSGPARKRIPNPATYFIWIYTLIGSQAIHILQLQIDFNTFMRKAELKIDKLREVVNALQRGEEVDVEKALGTGDEAQERDWAEALRQIENEDRIWQTNRQKAEARAKASEEAAREAEEENASPVNKTVDGDDEMVENGHIGPDGRPRIPRFY